MGNLKCHLFGVTSILLLIFLLPHPSHSQRVIDPELQAKIDAFITNDWLPGTQTTGMILTVVMGDGKEILFTTGYGDANIEKGIPNGNKTQFMTGSLSKGITAVLATKVLQEKYPELGESVLDVPISELLPEENVTLVDRFRSEEMSFRDLMAHRMCLWDQPMNADPFNSTEEIVFRARYNWEQCKFRQWNSYSNQMYVLAGYYAGLIANKPYEEAMQEFWTAAGMNGSAFTQKTDNFPEMPFRAMPYYVKDGQAVMMNTELTKRIKPANAAGGIYVTADDMARYLRLHLNLGELDGVQVLPKQVLQWIQKPSSMIPYYAFKNSDADFQVFNQFGYGLGLTISSFDGWEYLQHAGYYGPYSNLMSMMPGKKLGIFTSTHMGPMRNNMYILHGFIFEAIRGNIFAAEKYRKLLHLEGERQLAKSRIDNEKDAKTLYEEFVGKPFTLPKIRPMEIQLGKYGSGPAGDLEVSEWFHEERNETVLFIDYGKWYKGWLELHENDNVFRIHWVTDVVQDNYSVGLDENHQFAGFNGDEVTIWGSLGHFGTFKLGVGLDTLPRIPWAPDSCATP